MTGRNLLINFLIFVSANLSLFAQDTSSFKDRVNYIFANVDNSKVSTGLLSEYGLQIIPRSIMMVLHRSKEL